MKVSISPPMKRHERSRYASWLMLRIETAQVCTAIYISGIFSPFQDLYIWMGRVRANQLPAKISINEEGSNINLVATTVQQSNLISFRVEDIDETPILQVEIEPQVLVKAFCKGIIGCLHRKQDIDAQRFPNDDPRDINWAALLRPLTSIESWNIRQAWLHRSRARLTIKAGESQFEQQLSMSQSLLLKLHDALSIPLSLALHGGNSRTMWGLIKLYESLILDLALNELDEEWFLQRSEELENSLEGLNPYDYIDYHPDPERKSQHSQARLKTLELGQLVDGRVRQVKSVGIHVDIGGLFALIGAHTISQKPVDSTEAIFQRGDWVRSIVVWMDIEKGRVLLSTADLEVEPGDMLEDPLKVYATAEEMAERYRRNVVDRLVEMTISDDGSITD